MNIYFSDLTKDAQERLLKYVGVSDPKDANWDSDIIPVATFEIERNEGEDEYKSFMKRYIEKHPDIKLKDDGVDIDKLVEEMKESDFEAPHINPEDYKDLLPEVGV